MDTLLLQETPAETRNAVELTEHIVEVISDSGEGAQRCGQSFGAIAARMGYGIWTVEIIPAEIRPPARSVAGASGNRIRLGAGRITNGGDYTDLVVAFNEQVLLGRVRAGELKRGCIILLENMWREDFSNVTFLLEVRHAQLARAARPGQFVIVMLRPEGERIPLTIADYDAGKGTVTLVIQAVGKTTREMQRECILGSHLHALAGPMGIPSHAGTASKVVCVGGGLGVAPVFPQARAHKARGAYVIGVVGFRSRDLVFWEDKFRSCCDELIVCTNDGSSGIRGLVTDGLQLALDRHADVGEVVAIGPPIMMKACAELTRARAVRTLVSVNPIMVDGTGMCGGCRVKVGGKVRFACVDGPDFDGHQVDFADLMARLKRFEPEERRALSRWEESCRMPKPVEERLELPDPLDEVVGGE